MKSLTNKITNPFILKNYNSQLKDKIAHQLVNLFCRGCKQKYDMALGTRNCRISYRQSVGAVFRGELYVRISRDRDSVSGGGCIKRPTFHLAMSIMESPSSSFGRQL